MTETTHAHHWFACSWFAQLMSTIGGRRGRLLSGIALVVVGPAVVGGLPGMLLAVVGVVPLLAGLLDLCLFSALFGGPLNGSDIRSCARRAA